MTQAEVAEALEIRSATVSKYESEILEPNIEALKKYQNYLKLLLMNY